MRLIDADELNEKLERSIEWCRENLSESKASFQSGCIAATKDIINTVLFSKSVDAEPVRHGHWERVIPTKNAAKWSTKVSCSVCHKQGYTHHNYCPNCGAKMDEEDNT